MWMGFGSRNSIRAALMYESFSRQLGRSECVSFWEAASQDTGLRGCNSDVTSVRYWASEAGGVDVRHVRERSGSSSAERDIELNRFVGRA